MAEVTVEELGGGRYRVHVSDGAVSTVHTVRVPPTLPDTVGLAGTALVERSFAFLLEREPAGAILRDFSLEQIGHYFPEYEQTLRRSVTGGADPPRPR